MFMTPQEYIAKLQSVFGNPPIDKWDAIILKPFLARAPEIVRRLFDEGHLAFGIVNSPDVQAWVQPVDNSGCAIVFNMGLIHFLYSFARVIATRFHFSATWPPTEDDIQRFSNPTSFGDTARLLADALWWLKHYGIGYGHDHPIADNQTIVAAALASEAEIFALGHETAHAIYDVSVGGQFAVFGNAREQLPPLEGEIIADMLGAQLSFGMLVPEHPQRSMSIVYAGSVLLFQALRAADHLWPPSTRRPQTHPLPSIRYEAVEHVVKSGYPGAWPSITSIATAMSQLIDSALDATGIEESAADVSSEVSRLLVCLAEASEGWDGTIDKEYVGLVDALLWQLQQSDGRALLQFIGQFRDDLRRSPTRDRVLRLRLLARAIVSMYAPVKEVLLRALTGSSELPRSLID